MISLEKAIKKVERYRDDLVTHPGTAEAMTMVLDAARASQGALMGAYLRGVRHGKNSAEDMMLEEDE